MKFLKIGRELLEGYKEQGMGGGTEDPGEPTVLLGMSGLKVGVSEYLPFVQQCGVVEQRVEPWSQHHS